jgi:predicted DNA-binding WGR domain protein
MAHIDGYLGMYEFHDASLGSHKFYEVSRNHEPGRFVLRWGKVGTVGQAMNVDEAKAVAKIREKLTKGYKLVRGEIKEPVIESPGMTGPKYTVPSKSVVDDDVWAEMEKKVSGT